VTDIIRYDDEILIGIQKLPLAKQHTAKRAPEKLCMRAARAVQDQDRICNTAISVFAGLAERDVVDLKLRQCFAAIKPIVL